MLRVYLTFVNYPSIVKGHFQWYSVLEQNSMIYKNFKWSEKSTDFLY